MSAPTPIPVPKGFQRLGAFPLDSTSIFATLADLTAYASSGTAYTGQICSVTEATGTRIFKIAPEGELIELADAAHTHAISDTDGLQTALDGKQPTGSYATLVSGKVPADQLPSYVDDVLAFDTFAALPAVGETGKIYIAADKAYRWVEAAAGQVFVSGAADLPSTDGAYNSIGSTPALNNPSQSFLAYDQVNGGAKIRVTYSAGPQTYAWVIRNTVPVYGEQSVYSSPPYLLANFPASPVGLTFTAGSTPWGVWSSKPSIKTGFYHEVSPSEVTSVAGKSGAVTLTKSDVGLANVDDTSDSSKPISTAAQAALNGKQSVRNTESFTLQEGDNYLPATRNTLYILSGSFTLARIFLPTYLTDGTGPWIGDRIRIVWAGVKANANSRIVVLAFAGNGQYPSLAHLHDQDQSADFVLDNRPVNESGQLTWRSDVSPIRWVQPPATPTSAVAPNGGVYSPSDVAFDGSYFYIRGTKPDGSPVWLRSPMASTW